MSIRFYIKKSIKDANSFNKLMDILAKDIRTKRIIKSDLKLLVKNKAIT